MPVCNLSNSGSRSRYEFDVGLDYIVTEIMLKEEEEWRKGEEEEEEDKEKEKEEQKEKKKSKQKVKKKRENQTNLSVRPVRPSLCLAVHLASITQTPMRAPSGVRLDRGKNTWVGERGTACQQPSAPWYTMWDVELLRCSFSTQHCPSKGRAVCTLAVQFIHWACKAHVWSNNQDSPCIA